MCKSCIISTPSCTFFSEKDLVAATLLLLCLDQHSVISISRTSSYLNIVSVLLPLLLLFGLKLEGRSSKRK